MNEKNEHALKVADNIVVTLDYVLEVDGEVFDQSGDEAIQFLQGHEQIVPGLESQIYGMMRGESKKVVVSPVDGYGDETDQYAVVPLTEFPSEIPLVKGTYLQIRDGDGDVFDAYVDEVDEESVRLDFNHPLAGKELHFTVTVIDLRPAREEEIAHGHVHEEGAEL